MDVFIYRPSIASFFNQLLSLVGTPSPPKKEGLEFFIVFIFKCRLLTLKESV